MYDPDHIEHFYDAYGAYEWMRFEDSAYGRLLATIHSEFLKRHIKSDDRVIDVGSGPARFSIVMADLGAKVTLLDISPTQLTLARENLQKAGKLDDVIEFIQDDITKPLTRLQSGPFDTVVCFGGALSYAYEKRFAAADNVVQLCKPGGLILVSVPSRFGVIASVVRRADRKVLDDPEGNHLWRILSDGDLPGWMSKRIGIAHPPMHLFTSWEIGELFDGCTVVETIGCPVAAFEGQSSLDELASDPARWETILNVERGLNSVPGMIDNGSFILSALRR
jgi:SAM-dependent methyltransferase